MYVVISLDTKSLRVFSKCLYPFKVYLSLLYFHEVKKTQAQKYTVTGTYQKLSTYFYNDLQKIDSESWNSMWYM